MKRFTNPQFKNDIFNKCENNADWEIEDALGNTQTLRKDSSI